MTPFRKPTSYSRISKDKIGLELGVARQREDTDALAARLGLAPFVHRYVDNDRTATNGGPRPDYDELLAAIRRGEVDAVVVYAMGRLWRNRAERAAGMEIFRQHSVSVLCVKGPQLDLTTAAGRMLAGVLGEFDTFEVEQMSEREQRKMLQSVQHGAPPTGPRCYGYSPDGRTIIEDEAADVRGMFDDLFSGASLSGIAAGLNKRGRKNRNGREWTHNAVRNLLLNERYTALREYQGDLYPGSWPAIVSEDVWRSARHILTDEARRLTPGPGRRWLLSGLGRCGVCDDGTTVTIGSRGRSGVASQPVYRCRRTKHLARFALPIDDVVERFVIERVQRPDAAGLLLDVKGPDVAELQSKVLTLRARLDALAAEFAEDDHADPREFREATRRIRERIAELEAQMTHPKRARVLGDLVLAEDPSAVWESMTLDRQRAVVSELAQVTLLRGRVGRVPFDPSTVRILPADSPD